MSIEDRKYNLRKYLLLIITFIAVVFYCDANFFAIPIPKALALSLQDLNITSSSIVKVRLGPPQDQLHYECINSSTVTLTPTPTPNQPTPSSTIPSPTAGAGTTLTPGVTATVQPTQPGGAGNETPGADGAQKTYDSSSGSDQDDMAIWIHPNDKAQSVIIGSDKFASKIFLYNLDGTSISSIDAQKPGNIDIRYNFPLGNEKVDIVAFNQREGSQVVQVYKIDPNSRTLTRIDDGNIQAPGNYGFCMYHSLRNDKFYGITTIDSGFNLVRQIELFDNGSGKVSGREVRTINMSPKTEGCVADDEYGILYINEETKAIWKLGAEPDSPSTLSTKVDDTSGHANADLEGITIYYGANGDGYIIISSQGANEFDVYDRQSPHAYKATFKVSGASSTDGIDVFNSNLGSVYPQGAFFAHSGGREFFGVPWQNIAKSNNFFVNTSWNPRTPQQR